MKESKIAHRTKNKQSKSTSPERNAPPLKHTAENENRVRTMAKKIFKGGLLETMLLDLINEKGNSGLHGYGIILIMKKKYGVYLGPSGLYPELTRMEERNLVESTWTMSPIRPRRVYRITQKGQNLLEEYSAELRVIVPNLASKST